MLCFANPGEIDIRAVTTLGVSAKPETDSPIGFFGTGLKYAIAGVLRLGGRIEIWSGSSRFRFSAKDTKIRGHDFMLVKMDSQEAEGRKDLGFTTDLGKHWAPWQIYRELRSNVEDENGRVWTEDMEPCAGETMVKVWCEELDDCHANREEFWLEPSTLLWAGAGLEVHEKPSADVYYHRVRATHTTAGSAKYAFSYSLLGQQKLTEDRTFANDWEMRRAIATGLLACGNPEILQKVLSSTGAEARLDFDQFVEPGVVFRAEVLRRLGRKQFVQSSAREAVKRYAPTAVAAAEIEQVPDSWKEMQAEAPADREMESVSYYDYVSAVEKRMGNLEAQVRWWKRCAERLGGQSTPQGTP